MVQGAAATIEVYHDLICPWCFIGKRRFEVALSHHRGAPVVVRWQPFLLNPNMPSTGMDQRNYLALKFGGPRRAQQAHEMIARTARMDDLSLRLDAIERTPPTLDAHRFMQAVQRVMRMGAQHFERDYCESEHTALGILANCCAFCRKTRVFQRNWTDLSRKSTQNVLGAAILRKPRLLRLFTINRIKRL